MIRITHLASCPVVGLKSTPAPAPRGRAGHRWTRGRWAPWRSTAIALLLMLILTWNEYLLALMLSTADTQTLPLLIATQNATRGPQWWYMSVLILIMIVPVVAMAVALERYIRGGMLIGAVKG
jgi:hypothetical protein